MQETKITYTCDHCRQPIRTKPVIITLRSVQYHFGRSCAEAVAKLLVAQAK